MAEGAPLLREYVGKTCIEGSNPSGSARDSVFKGRYGLQEAPQTQCSRGFFVPGRSIVRFDSSGKPRCAIIGARGRWRSWCHLRGGRLPPDVTLSDPLRAQELSAAMCCIN